MTSRQPTSVVQFLGYVFLATLLLMPSAFAADSKDAFANATIKVIELTPGRYMLEGAGGNVGVSVGQDGILLIDDQYAPMADKIMAALQPLRAGAPSCVVNSHFHADHTGGNLFFAEHGAAIVAQTNVRTRLVEQRVPAKALPILTFDQELAIHFNGQNMRLLHLGPAHTDGDAIVLWQDGKVLHTGDLFFKDRFPFIDLEHGGSVLGYRDAVAKMLELTVDDTKIIPGHGTLASRADLLRFKHMLDDCINWMQDGKAANKTLAEMLATPLPKRWQDWGWNFIPKERWIRTLYDGVPAH